jgi:hypothetical protein
MRRAARQLDRLHVRTPGGRTRRPRSVHTPGSMRKSTLQHYDTIEIIAFRVETASLFAQSTTSEPVAVSATKILWGPILVVILIVATTTWAATQWIAWRLGFQPQLGEAWIRVAGVPLYAPPAFFIWWFRFGAHVPKIFAEGAVIAASGGVAAVVTAIAMSVLRAKETKAITTYGSARWATHQEIRAAGLLQPDGVVLGRLDRHYQPGACAVLCADTVRKRGRYRRARPADMA